MFALTWHAGDTPDQRAWLIDHHGATIAELQRRGRIAQATVVRDEEKTEHSAVRIARTTTGETPTPASKPSAAQTTSGE